MRTLLFVPLLLTLAAPLAAADGLQLVQPGDHDKTCPVLADEINGLASAAPAVATAPRRKGLGGLGKAFGTAMPLLGGAVPMLGMLGGGGGAAVMQAASVAGTAAARPAAQTVATDAARDAEAATVRGERRQRLLAIFEEKHC